MIFRHCYQTVLSYLSDNTKEYFCFIGQYSDMPKEKAQGASIILVPGYSRNLTQLWELLLELLRNTNNEGKIGY